MCILCNGETFTDMQLFGETHVEELRKYLELPHGIPTHDVFGDVFSRLDVGALEQCFQWWAQGLGEKAREPVIAIDGKTIRSKHEIPEKTR